MVLLKVLFNDKGIVQLLARLANIRNQLAMLPHFVPRRLALNPKFAFGGRV